VNVLNKSRIRKIGRFLTGALAGAWAVAMVGFTGYVLHFRPATVGYLFLLIVVSAAIFCGFWEATVVSILACGCLDHFFYQPLFVFWVSDPQDYAALGIFELSALVVSRLSSKNAVPPLKRCCTGWRWNSFMNSPEAPS
jgi:K+-sensing histidine kinase KdpD